MAWLQMLELACFFLVLFCTAWATEDTKPHILYILADDFGWANADWHRQHASSPEMATPFLSELVRDGVELDRMYSYKFCSPSRSSIQSGRNPIHVNVQNLDPTYVNLEDPISGFTGIPREMTGLGTVMKHAGYQTYFVGKWDCGMATPDHTPAGRGYDSSLLYFHHLNDYWTEQFYDTAASTGLSTCRDDATYGAGRPVDLWRGDRSGVEGGARGWNNSLVTCSVPTPEYCTARDATAEAGNLDCPAFPSMDTITTGVASERCEYEDGLFESEVRHHILEHDVSEPMFLFWALHVVHAPLQVPKIFLDLYANVAVDDWRRQRYLAMSFYMDRAVENVTELLRSKGMYENTLIVFTSDNGGPIYRNGSVGASNWPLRGGKASNWEGGIRVNAFVSGGFVPRAMRGRRLDGLGAIWDWYGTFAAIAGIDAFDYRAQASGLPAVDSINLWPYISGATANPPRTELALGASSCVNPSPGCINEWGDAPSQTIVNGIILDERVGGGGLWKLLVGTIPMNGWQGPQFPNATTLGWAAETSLHACGGGCLFQLDADPTEHQDIAAAHPERVQAMLSKLRMHNDTVFSPIRGQPDLTGACRAAMTRHKGFWGPWLHFSDSRQIVTLNI